MTTSMETSASLLLFLPSGAAASRHPAAGRPAAAALPAPLHQVVHQTAAAAHGRETETPQGQTGGAEEPAQTPRQTQVHLTLTCLLTRSVTH